MNNISYFIYLCTRMNYSLYQMFSTLKLIASLRYWFVMTDFHISRNKISKYVRLCMLYNLCLFYIQYFYKLGEEYKKIYTFN